MTIHVAKQYPFKDKTTFTFADIQHLTTKRSLYITLLNDQWYVCNICILFHQRKMTKRKKNSKSKTKHWRNYRRQPVTKIFILFYADLTGFQNFNSWLFKSELLKSNNVMRLKKKTKHKKTQTNNTLGHSVTQTSLCANHGTHF